MKNYKFLTSVIITLLASMDVIADWDNGGVVTSITDIVALQNGAFYIYAADDLCDEEKVNKVGYVYIGEKAGGLSQSPDGVTNMFSIALSAQMAGKRVRIYADDSDSNWGCLMGAIQVIN